MGQPLFFIWKKIFLLNTPNLSKLFSFHGSKYHHSSKHGSATAKVETLKKINDRNNKLMIFYMRVETLKHQRR